MGVKLIILAYYHKIFFQQLGKRLSALRKDMKLTQTQLANHIGTAQQLIASYEAGSRKIPVSVLIKMARLFAISMDELAGTKDTPAKRGPASRLQQQMEQISQMPRAKQKLAMDMLEAIIQQQQAS